MKWFLTSMLMLVLGVQALAQPLDSTKVVKGTAKLGKADAKGLREVTITLAVDKPYHIYANPVGNELLEPAATVVKFDSDVKVAKIAYPKGELHIDDAVGNYSIYEGKLTIKAKVKPKGDEPVKVMIRLQACSKEGCLIGGILKLTAK